MVSTIAASYGGVDAADVTHGFRIAFDVLFVLSLVAVVVAAAFLTPREPQQVGAEEEAPELLLEAA